MSAVARVFSAVWGGVDVFRKVLHLLVLLFVFAILISAVGGTAPSPLPTESALTIRPAGQLVDQLDGDAFDQAIAELTDQQQPQTLVQDIIDALDYAATDERIDVVFLELSSLGGSGLSKLQRIATALDEFKESGKPVVAYGDSLSQGAYYLAAQADEVYMHPQGILALDGFGRYLPYFRDAIEKLRLDWNIFRVGTHKSAVEPFLRMDMSPEDRERNTVLIGELWAAYATGVEQARGLDAGSVQSYADEFYQHTVDAGGDPAKAAVQQGMVDALKSRLDMRELLKTYTAEDDDGSYRRVGMSDYLAQKRLLDTESVKEENIGLIVASGSIVTGSQPPGTIGADSTSALLRDALEDDSIKAVVLQVDSGGGSAFASDIISTQIEALQAAGKPVVVSMSSVAASGGYWIAASADQLFANPTTITGSIGIFGMFATYQRATEYLGLNTDGIGTTRYAGQFRQDREMSDDAKALYQVIIEHGYDDFISRVATHRGMDKATVDSIGQGKVWTGREALANGLVDELGSVDDAIAAAAELAGLSDYAVKRVEKGLSPTEQLLLDLMSVSVSMGLDPKVFAPEPTGVQKILGELESAIEPLSRFNDPKGVYAYCFCEVY
ncbi:MAG: signal peptide peptidase SppA [Pseudomonadota bacterium]